MGETLSPRWAALQEQTIKGYNKLSCGSLLKKSLLECGRFVKQLASTTGHLRHTFYSKRVLYMTEKEAMTTPVAERIAHLHERITTAAHQVGRSPEEITLIAVSKTHPPERIAQAVAAGVRHLGENRLQEAEPKIRALAAPDALPVPVSWHFIGHLQRNKARKAAGLFALVHSLDSVPLADMLNQQRANQQGEAGQAAPLPVLVQVNVSGETSKEGFALPGGKDNPTRFVPFLQDLEHILSLPHLAVRGFMTIAPYSPDPETARPVFRTLRLLRDELARRFPTAHLPHLSMGMSDDFLVAIEEGATFVRVGRAIFGERPRLDQTMPH